MTVPFHNVHDAIFFAAPSQKTAIKFPSVNISYGDLALLVRSVANRLANKGVGRNSTVAIWEIGGFGFTLSALAISLLGGRFLLATKFAIIIGPRIGITHHIRRPENLPGTELDNTIHFNDDWFRISSQPIPNWQDFDGPSSPESAYMIAQSSGSTGAPKFIELSHRCMTARLSHNLSGRLFSYEKIGSLFSPMTFPGHSTLLNSLGGGMTYVGGNDPEFHSAEGTEALIGSPAQFRPFIDKIPSHSKKFRECVSGGAPITQAFINLVSPHFEKITNRLASTEVGLIADTDVTSSNFDVRYVGNPSANAEVQIVDHENQLMPAGQEGIIRVKSPRAITRYFIETDEDHNVFQDGYFYPGDVGFLDNSNRLYITGRTRDVFNINGIKINATRIDNLLGSVPGVKDVMAFVGIDDAGFPVLSAAIQYEDNFNQNTILKEIRNLRQTTIYKFDIPRQVYFVQNITRNDNGKLNRLMAQNSVENLPKYSI